MIYVRTLKEWCSVVLFVVFFLLILLTDAKKRKALLQYSKFLKVIGGETNSFLGNLLSPEAPSAKAAEVLFEVLKEHLKHGQF